MKLALERKEAEMKQLKSGSICRTVQDVQKMKAVSPLHLKRYGATTNLKPEIIQHPMDDIKSIEVSHDNPINSLPLCSIESLGLFPLKPILCGKSHLHCLLNPACHWRYGNANRFKLFY